MTQDTCAPQNVKAAKSEELAALSAISNRIFALEELMNEMKEKNLRAVRQHAAKSREQSAQS